MKIYPDKNKFLEQTEDYNLLPVYTKIKSDLDTALSAFIKTGGDFFLESVENINNIGRFSIIGIGCKTRFTLRQKQLEINEYQYSRLINTVKQEADNPLELIQNYFKNIKYPVYSELPPFNGGAIGYLGFETVSYFEKIPVKKNDTPIPDGILIIPEKLLVYDNIARTIYIIIMISPQLSPADRYKNAVKTIQSLIKKLHGPVPELKAHHHHTDLKVTTHTAKKKYLDSVKKCRQYIKNGDIIQAVIAQQFSMQTSVAPLAIYRALRILNPSPYMFFLNFQDFKIIGSSPEVMVKLENDNVMVKPIAGTRKRGENPEHDDQLAEELLNDPKEKAEHLMLVDLGRNDLGRIALPGSVSVSDYMAVEKYSHVMHIVSTVNARLKQGKNAFDAIKATFPAGTLSGAPKIRAIEIINELEDFKRGPYGGMILTLGFNGNLNSCITIRTM
ncbi:MAG TPA: chorismate-binding protein, partial [Spirochaetota bacterium]|nr:chorismate-binding protein [Spirochaetota bacterium]